MVAAGNFYNYLDNLLLLTVWMRVPAVTKVSGMVSLGHCSCPVGQESFV